MAKDTPRLSIRLTENQMLVLDELKNTLNVSYSMLLRTIVLHFLTENEDVIERVITSKNKEKLNGLINERNMEQD